MISAARALTGAREEIQEFQKKSLKRRPVPADTPKTLRRVAARRRVLLLENEEWSETTSD
jgi:hypothetical protein